MSAIVFYRKLNLEFTLDSCLKIFFSFLLQIRLWLYCFQKSVALVLSKLLLSSSKSYPDTKQAIAQYRNNHRKMSNNIPHNDTDIFTRLTRVGSVNTVNTAPLPSVSVSSWKESEKVEVISGNLNNNTTSSSSCSDAENYRGMKCIMAILQWYYFFVFHEDVINAKRPLLHCPHFITI